jgi:hypothetical protein
VRSAGTIRKHSSLAGWLHGVALRLSRKARADAMKEGRSDERFVTEALPDPSNEVSWREVRQILDEELQRLPERYRLPLILCYLQGKTRDEAAAELGWTASQLKGILARGRNRLRKRLIQRGLASSAAGALLLTETVLASSLSPQLCITTLRSALDITMGKGHHVCGLSARVSRLVEGGANVMGTRKIVMNVLFALGLGVVWAGTVLWAQQPQKQVENPTSPPSVARTEPEIQREEPNTVGAKRRKAEDDNPRAKNEGPRNSSSISPSTPPNPPARQFSSCSPRPT